MSCPGRWLAGTGGPVCFDKSIDEIMKTILGDQLTVHRYQDAGHSIHSSVPHKFCKNMEAILLASSTVLDSNPRLMMLCNCKACLRSIHVLHQAAVSQYSIRRWQHLYVTHLCPRALIGTKVWWAFVTRSGSARTHTHTQVGRFGVSYAYILL
jgi:hypothetical protein